MMQGQELPSLEVAKEIVKGVLPNGMEYYLVTAAGEKGFADYALVQKGQEDISKGREELLSLPHFNHRKPYRFLSENGIGYSDRGYIKHLPEASIFSFSNVPVYKQQVADSTLMMLFDIASLSSDAQAVIVSGDISPDKIRERMQLLSMVVPRRPSGMPVREYMWNPVDTLTFRVTENLSPDVAVINAIYSAERLPRESMNTAQPLVSKAFAYILGHIVEKRVSRAFSEAGIPLAEIRYRYQDSSQSAEDERYSFTLVTSSRHLAEASRLFATVLSELDKGDTGMSEFQDAKDKLVSETLRDGGGSLSNADYVQKCISAYLYGSNLASEQTINGFIARRNLSSDAELTLFNDFAAAVLDSARNLTLRYDVPDRGISRRAILSEFNSAWNSAAPGRSSYKEDYSDTLSLFKPKGKVKIKKEAAEPISGGKLWTFSNGIKVVYRKTSVKGEFHYAMLMRGGIASVPNLASGEGAFVGDMLALSEIAGLNGRDFLATLNANGITMKSVAGVSDFRLTGTAPSTKLNLLLRSLLSVADSRHPDKQAFDYYRSSEALRLGMESLSPRDVYSLLDSIIHPHYYYTDRKQIDNLGDDLPERAEAWFESQFSKVNDGMLVFVGDIDEEALKKELCSTLGSFRVKKVFAQRPSISSRYFSGTAMHTAEAAPGLIGGGEIGVSLAVSAAIPFTMKNYMSLKVAQMCISRALSRSLADCGAFAEVSDKLEVFPEERMTVYVNCRPCRADGLPAGMDAPTPFEILDAIGVVTRMPSNLSISKEDLNAYKNELLGLIEHGLQDSATITDNVLLRYSEGKDIVTGYKAAVASVSEQSVKEVLSMLQAGAGVEYVIF